MSSRPYVFRGSWANLRNLRETSAHCGTGNDGDNEVEGVLMSTCEKCWGDAYVRWMTDQSKDQAEHYQDLLAERVLNPCSKAEQNRDREEN
jgi:hypothetical protein